MPAAHPGAKLGLRDERRGSLPDRLARLAHVDPGQVGLLKVGNPKGRRPAEVSLPRSGSRGVRGSRLGARDDMSTQALELARQHRPLASRHPRRRRCGGVASRARARRYELLKSRLPLLLVAFGGAALVAAVLIGVSLVGSGDAS